MTEEQKNIQFINKKLLKQHIKLSEKELKAVYNICCKYYKEGLEQGRFDLVMDHLLHDKKEGKRNVSNNWI